MTAVTQHLNKKSTRHTRRRSQARHSTSQGSGNPAAQPQRLHTPAARPELKGWEPSGPQPPLSSHSAVTKVGLALYDISARRIGHGHACCSCPCRCNSVLCLSRSFGGGDGGSLRKSWAKGVLNQTRETKIHSSPFLPQPRHSHLPTVSFL